VGITSAIFEIFIDDGTVMGLLDVYNNLAGYTAFAGGGSV